MDPNHFGQLLLSYIIQLFLTPLEWSRTNHLNNRDVKTAKLAIKNHEM